MKKIGLFASVLTLLLSNVVIAAEKGEWDATLTSVKGKVMVDLGDGFAIKPEGTRLDNGNRVFAMDDSVAVISYENGCDHKVEGTEIVTVGDACGVVAWEGTMRPNPSAALVGGLGGLGLIGIDNGKSDKPASP